MRKVLRSRLLVWMVVPLFFMMCTTPENPAVPVPDPGTDPVETPDTTSTDPGEIEVPEWHEVLPEKYGISYLYDWSCLPEIHIEVTLDEWNKLLTYYDEDHATKKYVVCSVTYDKAGDQTTITDVAIRLRGNTSRFRPEGKSGEMHVADRKAWNRCHYQLNFRKLVKDEAHELHGARKVILKFNNGDGTYVREIYAYDLFRRDGVWTAAHEVFSRVFIHVEGDTEESYLGVYGMVEPIDDEFLKVRKEKFGSKDGNLWKCRIGASLRYGDGKTVGPDNEEGIEYVYELKTNTETFDAAQAQLDNFRHNVTYLSGQAFHDWIGEHCDVPLLLKTYAVNVVLGNWDDYWNNANNYYIYFNSTATETYKFFFLPYDYDNCLGTSLQIGSVFDSGTTSPYKWGISSNPLIAKIIEFQDYRDIYTKEIRNLIEQSSGLFYYSYSMDRIAGWHQMITPYLKNDTGHGSTIKDQPASWGNRSFYRLMDEGNGCNFFKVRTSYLKNVLEDK